MTKLHKIVGVSLLLGLLSYPTYKIAKDYAQSRDLKIQHVSDNFSKYLRYGS